MVSNSVKTIFRRYAKTYEDHAMLKLAYIDLQDYLNTLQDKHKELEKQLKEVEQTLEENPNSKKIRQNILKLNNNLIVMNVKSNRLKKKLMKKDKY